MNKNSKTAKKYQTRKKFDKTQRGAAPEAKDAWTASRDEAGSRVKGSNDVSWYVTDNQILNDVARIPYSLPVGYPLIRTGKASAGLLPAEFDDAIPGIAAMAVVPTLGNAEYANDAVNVAGNGFYTFLRHLNSGSRNYDPVDSLIYVMSMDSVYYTISWATRIYATLSLYAQGNRYLPDALLLAQGIDYVDFRKNMAQFRARLNQCIRKISTLVVPNIMPIFVRHSWLFSNYFIEGDSIKDQIYLFRPSAWYSFGYDQDEAGKLNCHVFQGTSTLGSRTNLISVDDLIEIIDTMIDPIFANEDFNIMSGDILKAYGSNNVMKLGLIPDELPISLSYDEKVLLQFKNAKPINLRTRTDGGTSITSRYFYDHMFDVEQSAGKTHLIVRRNPAALYVSRDFAGFNYGYDASDPVNLLILQAMFNQYSKSILLTSPHSEVTPEENMENTRLTLALGIEYDSSDENPIHIRINNMYFGSEWPTEVDYWCIHRDRALGTNTMFSRNFYSLMVLSTYNEESTRAAATSFLPIRSAFKYAPELSILVNDSQPDGDPAVQESGRTIFEVDNYTLVDPEVIAMLHNAAIQGEYNIPRIALFASK